MFPCLRLHCSSVIRELQPANWINYPVFPNLLIMWDYLYLWLSLCSRTEIHVIYIIINSLWSSLRRVFHYHTAKCLLTFLTMSSNLSADQEVIRVHQLELAEQGIGFFIRWTTFGKFALTKHSLHTRVKNHFRYWRVAHHTSCKCIAKSWKSWNKINIWSYRLSTEFWSCGNVTIYQYHLNYILIISVWWMKFKVDFFTINY